MTPLPLLGCIALAAVCSASEWNYDTKGKHGPSDWPDVCQSGRRQSPIDIAMADITVKCRMAPLIFGGYGIAMDKTSVLNNGHTVEVHTPEGVNYTLRGGGLGHVYEFAQFHLHWGVQAWRGSEHTVAHLANPVEIHFVHVRAGVPLAEAIHMADGLAVVAVRVNVDTKNKLSIKAFDTLIQQGFDHVLEEGQEAVMHKPLTFMHLLPVDTHTYYRYDGSLTTPGCFEAVVWTVLAQPISITRTQLGRLRKVLNGGGGAVHNYRPTQPINGRAVQLVRPNCLIDSGATSINLPTIMCLILAAICHVSSGNLQ